MQIRERVPFTCIRIRAHIRNRRTPAPPRCLPECVSSHLEAESIHHVVRCDDFSYTKCIYEITHVSLACMYVYTCMKGRS